MRRREGRDDIYERLPREILSERRDRRSLSVDHGRDYSRSDRYRDRSVSPRRERRDHYRGYDDDRRREYSPERYMDRADRREYYETGYDRSSGRSGHLDRDRDRERDRERDRDRDRDRNHERDRDRSRSRSLDRHRRRSRGPDYSEYDMRYRFPLMTSQSAMLPAAGAGFQTIMQDGQLFVAVPVPFQPNMRPIEPLLSLPSPAPARDSERERGSGRSFPSRARNSVAAGSSTGRSLHTRTTRTEAGVVRRPTGDDGLPIITISAASPLQKMGGSIAHPMRVPDEDVTMRLMVVTNQLRTDYDTERERERGINAGIKAIIIANGFLAGNNLVVTSAAPEFESPHERGDASFALHKSVLDASQPVDLAKMQPARRTLPGSSAEFVTNTRVPDAMPGELSVSSQSKPATVGGAIAAKARKQERICLTAIGAGAVTNAVKAISVAQRFLASNNVSLSFRPEFRLITMEKNKDINAIQLTVTVTPGEGGANFPPEAPDSAAATGEQEQESDRPPDESSQGDTEHAAAAAAGEDAAEADASASRSVSPSRRSRRSRRHSDSDADSGSDR